MNETPRATPSIPTALVPAEPATSNEFPVGGFSPPSIDEIPVPPSGYVALPLRRYTGYRPSNAELVNASGVIVDLARFTDYAMMLGTAAPEALSVAKALGLALHWRAVRTRSAAWEAYVRQQDAMAWQAALLLTEELKQSLLPLLEKNGSVREKYPRLLAFLRSSKETGKRGSATKKKRAKEKAEAAQAAAEAAAVKAVADATAAANAATVPTPAKTITVNV